MQLLTVFSMLFPTFDILRLSKAIDTLESVVIEYDGAADFNKKKCKKISIRSKEQKENGEEPSQYMYFDEVSNYFLGMDMPSQNATITCEGFKRVKGMVYPTTIKILQNGKKVQEMEIDKLEANIELKDSLFEKPF